MIQAALAARPVVSAPPSGDWSGFSERLDAALRTEAGPAVPLPFVSRPAAARRPFVGLLATAALLAVVSASVFMASQAGQRMLRNEGGTGNAGPGGSDDLYARAAIAQAAADAASPIQAGLTAVGARHLERSKLVVLGLSAKAPGAMRATDWAYERELATALLTDTQLYRMAAEERGLTSLAGVMRDLEIVLLQTSMAQATDDTALPQIQRLIRKRGLVEKMDGVGTTGLMP